MSELKPGIYEQIINEEIKKQLSAYTEERAYTKKLEEAEASSILSQYVEKVLYHGLNDVLENGGDLAKQVELSNKIIELIKAYAAENSEDNPYAKSLITKETEELLGISDQGYYATGKPVKDMTRPETPISQSSLFTGSKAEPSMSSELAKEIASCNTIYMLVSFIKWSGLRNILKELRTFVTSGGKLRIITTSYMGATDAKAVEELRKLRNTEIKISYDTRATRLHAKSYIFLRDNNYSTAYIGSSNLSEAAISNGLEWNIKITNQDQPNTLKKVTATFEAYWNSPDFELYQDGDFDRLYQALEAAKNVGTPKDKAQYFFDLQPYTYQQEILDKLVAEREIRGYTKNLVVAATGTGKTVISAFDYKNYCAKHPSQSNRLLFVAHRKEILEQSLHTFRAILRDKDFGDLFVGGIEPRNSDHLFISIQTLNSRELLTKLDPSFYDFIIIDEFHHASADSYQSLLNYFTPKILLGLTATPERMDGEDIRKYFNYRTAAEIRLPEAINRQLLCPFNYYGIADSIDLANLTWSQGKYKIAELNEKYTGNESRAMEILRSVHDYVTDISQVHGIGFCVTVEHAKFMAEFCNKHNVPSLALSGESSEEERNSAKAKLVSGDYKFIFVVDLYNEGVDIPEIDTVLFLRPTESLTVFIQQLGRGLRLSKNKDCLTVLDFVGHANKRYSFEEKFAAMLITPGRNVEDEIKHDFPNVPRGCCIKLEAKAKEYVLENIKASLRNKRGIITRLKAYKDDTDLPLTLSNFLKQYNLQLKDIYPRNSFAALCQEAEVFEAYASAASLPFDHTYHLYQEPAFELVTKRISSFLSTDSLSWLQYMLNLISKLQKTGYSPEKLSLEAQGYLRMFYYCLFNKYIPEGQFASQEISKSFTELAKSPIMLEELKQLYQYRIEQIDFVEEAIDIGFTNPLELHCTYTRDQILVGLGYAKPSTVREGVKWLPANEQRPQGIDVLFVTLNKTDKDYSPTTLYNDYSVNDKLFHWQSQSTTSDASPTGQRYIHHQEEDSHVLLFVRNFKNENGVASPYTYLGKVFYKEHNGSRPMSILWKLEKAIPAKFLKNTEKLLLN